MLWQMVVGLGEVGDALYQVLVGSLGHRVSGYDINNGIGTVKNIVNVRDGADRNESHKYDVLHICIPWSDKFVGIVEGYASEFRTDLIIVHSTVPIGTTRKIKNAVHSPVLGSHYNMRHSLATIAKWVGGPKAAEAAVALRQGGIPIKKVVETSEQTEAMKLLDLSKYGVCIALAAYGKTIADAYGFPFEDILAYDENYNKSVEVHQRRPLLTPPGDTIGGHCVMPGTKLLNLQHPNQMLQEVLRYERARKYTAWSPCNIYSTAKIGEGVNIGAFTEIGPNVVIGDRVRIGAHCFIPEGVSIEDDAWIGPRVTFANDKRPPSHRSGWEPITVKKGAVLGASVCVLPGVVIGEMAVVGMGAVVTKNVGPGEVVAGNPASPIIPKTNQEASA